MWPSPKLPGSCWRRGHGALPAQRVGATRNQLLHVVERACPCLMSECPCLIGEYPCLIETCTCLIRECPRLSGDCPRLMRECPRVIGATPNRLRHPLELREHGRPERRDGRPDDPARGLGEELERDVVLQLSGRGEQRAHPEYLRKGWRRKEGWSFRRRSGRWEVVFQAGGSSFRRGREEGREVRGGQSCGKAAIAHGSTTAMASVS